MDRSDSNLRSEDWNNFIKSLTGWNPQSEFLSPIPSALVIYLSIYFVGLICHQMTRLVCPGIIKSYILDFIKTMTVCAYPFGHGIIRKYYGEVGYMCAMIPMVFLTLITLREGDGNPIAVWHKYFNKVIPLWKCVLKTFIQILAGFSAFHLGIYVMGLKLHPMYGERLQAYYDQFCTTDLHVPVYVGFLLEFSAVIYDSWFSNQTFTGHQYFDLLIKIINAGLLVVSGVHLTGMYIHPAMASGHTWGCGDTSPVEHIFIYWVGPMIGTWISIKLQHKFTISRKGKSVARKGKIEPNTKKRQNNNNNNNNIDHMVVRNGSEKKNAKRRFFHS